jgi:hypothetical protein
VGVAVDVVGDDVGVDDEDDDNDVLAVDVDEALLYERI